MIGSPAIREQLSANRESLPSRHAIAGWDVEVGHDWVGDDAVWVWIVLRDDLIDQVWPMPIRDALREGVRDIVQRAAGSDDVQVYIRFRSESEHRGIVGETWAG